MSIDLLQERIRKYKSPLIVDLSMKMEHIPPQLREGKSPKDAYAEFCMGLLDSLQGKCAGVRCPFDRFALLGGLQELSALMKRAAELGYYVLLEGPAIHSPWGAESAAEAIFGEESQFPCHGLILSPWIGSDAIKPFLPCCKDHGKSLFILARSANKTAAELQDLMTGGRLTHVAAADVINRHGESIVGKCGYSQVGSMTAATNAASITGLRNKYKRMFLLVDGIDYPGGNAKNCSLAFDSLGHGAAVCAGPDLVAAWIQAENDGSDYADLAAKAVERLKNNIARYISIW